MSLGPFNTYAYNKRVYNGVGLPVAAVVTGAFGGATTGTTGHLLAPTAGGSLEGSFHLGGVAGASAAIVASAGLSASPRTAAGVLGSTGTFTGAGALAGRVLTEQAVAGTAVDATAGVAATVIRVLPAGTKGTPPAVVAAGGTVEPMRVTTGAT